MNKLQIWKDKANGLLQEIDKTICDFDLLIKLSDKENIKKSRKNQSKTRKNKTKAENVLKSRREF